MQIVGGNTRVTASIPIIAATGLGLFLLALRNFEAFMVALLFIRALADYSKQGASRSVMGPAPTSSGRAGTLLAATFIIAGVAWLFAQARSTTVRRGTTQLERAFAFFVCGVLISVPGSSSHFSSLLEAARLSAVFLMLVVLDRLITDRRRMLLVLGACFASALIPITLGAYQAVTAHGTFFAQGLNRIRGPFVHPSPFSSYLTFLIVMGAATLPSLSGRRRQMLFAIVVACAGMLMLTYTRSGWAGTAVGLLYVGWRQNKKLLWFMLGGIALAAILVPSVGGRVSNLEQERHASGTAGNSLVWRFDYWKQVAPLANSNPVTGIGWGMTETKTDIGKPPHNDLLRSYVEAGVLGFLGYVALIGTMFSTAHRAVKRATTALTRSLAVGFMGCALAFGVMSIGTNLITQVAVLWYFIAFAAIASVIARGGAGLDADPEAVSVER